MDRVVGAEDNTVASDGQRFAIARSRWWRPLLALFGGTAARSYVTVNDDGCVARFGFNRIALPHEHIAAAEVGKWPWYGGIGWRTNFKDTLGLIGTRDGVVLITLAAPVRTRLLKIPITVTKLYVSVEDPQGVIAALGPSR